MSVKEEKRAETTPKSGKKRALLALAGAQVIDNGEGQILNTPSPDLPPDWDGR